MQLFKTLAENRPKNEFYSGEIWHGSCSIYHVQKRTVKKRRLPQQTAIFCRNLIILLFLAELESLESIQTIFQKQKISLSQMIPKCPIIYNSPLYIITTQSTAVYSQISVL